MGVRIGDLDAHRFRTVAKLATCSLASSTTSGAGRRSRPGAVAARLARLGHAHHGFTPFARHWRAALSVFAHRVHVRCAVFSTVGCQLAVAFFFPKPPKQPSFVTPPRATRIGCCPAGRSLVGRRAGRYFWPPHPCHDCVRGRWKKLRCEREHVICSRSPGSDAAIQLGPAT